jgi:hypothetical protein
MALAEGPAADQRMTTLKDRQTAYWESSGVSWSRRPIISLSIFDAAHRERTISVCISTPASHGFCTRACTLHICYASTTTLVRLSDLRLPIQNLRNGPSTMHAFVISCNRGDESHSRQSLKTSGFVDRERRHPPFGRDLSRQDHVREAAARGRVCGRGFARPMTNPGTWL